MKMVLLCFSFIVMIGVIGFNFNALAVELEKAEVKTSGEGLVTRLAPGEFLPFSVKLINFGSTRRVDVSINYRILNSEGVEVFSGGETVAVETTASFIKQVQLPDDILPGRYTAVSNIIYDYQEVPATSKFQFTVEKKILGIFQSRFILYGSITLLISIAFAVVSRVIIKRQRAGRLTPHEYLNVPRDDRMYYELISDTIMQMRTRVGDPALEIARGIGSLVINEDSGKVLEIKGSPAKIMALLILYYEKYLGERVSFGLRDSKQKPMDQLAAVNKNLVTVRKYFE